MKLSEMFSEVYDDNWTDAVEELSSEGIEEKTVVILLRDMVMVSLLLYWYFYRNMCFTQCLNDPMLIPVFLFVDCI